MPRPLRIEYENAYYHVMNRGRARQKIFHDDRYYEDFLATLAEAHQRFGVQILCYCLMNNHYHLLLKTPEGNLGRVMRHINGVYTQRYNRLKKTDGSLFRGRYKAVCVEEDSYQLRLSRYIHQNPLEARVVDRLEDYPWSSYGDYIDHQRRPPRWLYLKEVYAQLGVKTRLRQKYQAFVELGVDEEIQQFYGKGNMLPYLGSDVFREWIYRHRLTDEASITREISHIFRPSIDEIVEKVANQFKTDHATILKNKRGRVANNIPRWVSMYLSQECGGHKLKDIAAAFGLKQTGSIPTTIKKLRVMMDEDLRLLKVVKKLKSQYDI